MDGRQLGRTVFCNQSFDPSFEAIDFEHLKIFKVRTETRFEILTASNFEPSQSFRSEKVSHLGVLTRDRRF